MTMLHHGKTNSGHVGSTQLGSSTPCGLLTRFGSFRLHLFASIGHALAEQRFGSYERVKKWLDEWFAAKGENFYWRGIHKLPERWEKCVTNNGATLNKSLFIILPNLTCFFLGKKSSFHTCTSGISENNV